MAKAYTQPENYPALRDAKVAELLPGFEALSAPEPTVFSSEPEYYRMRAEFRMWHSEDELSYVMFDPAAPKTPIPLQQFPVACARINALMPALIEAIKPQQALRHRLFQIEFLCSSQDECLVSLIYHRPLDDAWEALARELVSELGIHIIGRSRKQKIVLSQDFITETLSVDGKAWHYRQYEGGFTQPNARVNEKMLSWACEQARHCQGDLLELYCGNGNFTLPLSEHFPKVLATEIAKTSVRAAEHNISVNQRENIAIARLSAEEMTSAMQRERSFRRLADIDLDSYQLSTAFVDPPRAGLDDHSRAMLAGFSDILYISCNPNTLLRDLKALQSTHSIEALAFFDQFPYTPHLECGVRLRSR